MLDFALSPVFPAKRHVDTPAEREHMRLERMARRREYPSRTTTLADQIMGEVAARYQLKPKTEQPLNNAAWQKHEREQDDEAMRMMGLL